MTLAQRLPVRVSLAVLAGALAIGVTACELMREEGERLHCRKLRAFNEPPFR